MCIKFSCSLLSKNLICSSKIGKVWNKTTQSVYYWMETIILRPDCTHTTVEMSSLSEQTL